jgi:hypothetical protein
MTARTKPYRCGYPCDCLIDPKAPPQLDTCSYGGGHQSTALLVLAAREVIPTRTFLFCNVGDDSEHPGTLEYVREVAAPYAAFHGLDLHTLTRQRRDGTEETLMGRLLNPIKCRTCRGTGSMFTNHHDDETAPCPDCGGAGERESKSLPIPVRMSNGAPNSRSCLAWMRPTAPATPATAGPETSPRTFRPAPSPPVPGGGVSDRSSHRAVIVVLRSL